MPISENIGSVPHIPARGLQQPCPPSLQRALHSDLPNLTFWLALYEDKNHVFQDIAYKGIFVDAIMPCEK